MILVNHANAEYDSREVPQVEDVVALAWSGQQVLHGALVYLERASDHRLSTRDEVGGESLLTHVRRHQHSEDPVHGVVVEGRH